MKKNTCILILVNFSLAFQGYAQPYVNTSGYTKDSQYFIQVKEPARIDILDLINKSTYSIASADKYAVFDLLIVNNEIFYTCGREGIIRKWNVKGELLQSYGQTIYSLNTIVIDTISNVIIGGGGDGHLYIWDIVSGKYIKEVKVHSEGISSSSLMGNTLYTSGFDGSLYKTSLSAWSSELLYESKEHTIYDLYTAGTNYLLFSALKKDKKEHGFMLLAYDLTKQKISDNIQLDNPGDMLFYGADEFSLACSNSTSLGLKRYGNSLDKFTFHDPSVVIGVHKKGKVSGDLDKELYNLGILDGYSHFSPNLKLFITMEAVYKSVDYEGIHTWWPELSNVDTLSVFDKTFNVIIPSIKKEIEELRKSNVSETSDIVPVVQNSFLKAYEKILSADSSRMAVSNESNVIKIYDINQKKLLSNITYKSAVVRLASHPSEPIFASLHVDGTLNIWDFENLVLLKSYAYMDKDKFIKSYKKRHPEYLVPDPLNDLREAQSYGNSVYEVLYFSNKGDEIMIFNPWVEKSAQNFTRVNILNDTMSNDASTIEFNDRYEGDDIVFDVIGDSAFLLDYENCYYTENRKNSLYMVTTPNAFIDSVYNDINESMDYIVPATHSSNQGYEIVLDYGKSIYSIDLRTLRNNNFELANIPNKYSRYTEKIKFRADNLTVPKGDKYYNYFTVDRYIDTLYAKVVMDEYGTRVYGENEIRNNLNDFYYDRSYVDEVKQLKKREYYKWDSNQQFPEIIERTELDNAEKEIAMDEAINEYGEYICEDVGWYEYVGEDYVTEWEYLAQETDRIRLITNTTQGISVHSENCKYYTSLLPTNGVVIVEAENKKEYGRIPAQSSRIMYQEFLRKSNYFITTNLNGEIKFWEWKDKLLAKPVVTFIGSKDELFVMTPDFYYSALTPRANNIMFRKNGVLFGYEQFDLKFNRPDIVLQRIGLADSTLVQAYHKAYQKRLKKMGFTEDMLKDDFHLPEIEIENFEFMPSITDSTSIGLNLHLKDDKYNLDRINVWVNDVAVYGSGGISLRARNINSYSTYLNVNLVKGTNSIQVSVLNQAGAESYKETLEIESTAGKDKPNLYLITIGESEFEESNYNLTYAAKDAKDVANLFSKSEVYENVFTKTLVNKEVTRINVQALNTFIDQAGINDEVMVFIAGHGVLDKELDYFFATYDMDFNNPSEKGLAYEDLEGLLDGIKPLKKMLFIDACHSGEIDKEEVKLIVQNTTNTGGVQFRAVGNTVTQKLGIQNTSELTKSLFTDLRKGTGATVISSAGGMEFAMEGDDWNNGLFTYCLINGIKSKKADLNKDGEIWLSELKQYVSDQVTKLSNGKQQPTSRIENQVLDYRVW